MKNSSERVFTQASDICRFIRVRTKMKVTNSLNAFIRSTLLLLTAAVAVHAIPALGDTLEVKQPDGSTVKVRVFGDEFYRRVESLDGYTLVRNSDKWICFAEEPRTRSADSLHASSTIYHGGGSPRSVNFRKHLDISDEAREKRIEKARFEIWGESGPGVDPVRQVEGEIVGATILIDFPDDTATISVSDMDDFMNKPGFSLFGNNGSVRDYYLDVSQGKVDYSNRVVGYYRAAQPKSYYEDNNLKLVLIDEAYRNIDKIFDFSQCTYNIKAVKAVNILYAGPCNSAWGQGLWPHAGTHRYETDEGLILTSYQMAAIDTGLAIGPTVHENGHMLFNLKDLYDSKGDSYGIGFYCLMCYGCFTPNPAPINAYFRELAGWETPVDITDSAEGTILKHETNSMSSFVYRNSSNSRESFYIESRRRAGRNTYTTDEGLMIWHVDSWSFSQYPDMTPAKHFKVSLEQADGNFDMEKKVNAGDTTDLYKAGIYSSFGSASAPSSDWWKDGVSGFNISNISAVSDSMNFTLGEGATSVIKNRTNSATEISLKASVKNLTFTADSETSIHKVSLFTVSGKEIFSSPVNGESSFIMSNKFSPGLYISQIVVGNSSASYQTCSKKLLIP